MLSCVKAFPHQLTSNHHDDIVTAVPLDDGAAAAHQNYKVEMMELSVVATGEPDSLSLSAATTGTRTSSLADVNATSFNDDSDRMEPQDYDGIIQVLISSQEQQQKAKKNLGDSMATLDVIICTMVGAFVALQYREISRTCR